MPSAKVLIGGAVATLGARINRRRTRRRRVAEQPVVADAAEPPEEDPEIGADEVRELRADLRRELERLAGADIKASRTRRESQSPPG
jgi:hypothetical protein